MQSRFPRRAACGCDVRKQRADKGVDQRHRLLHRLAHEAAIGAARRAEGDAEVEADVLRGEGGRRRHGRLRRGEAELRPVRCDLIEPPKALSRGGIVRRLLQHAPHQLRRADAAEFAPGGLFPKAFYTRAVKALAQYALGQAVGDDRVGQRVPAHPGAARVPDAAAQEQRRRRAPGFAVAEADRGAVVAGWRRRVGRALGREQRQQHLLHRVFAVVISEDQIHKMIVAHSRRTGYSKNEKNMRSPLTNRKSPL